jgi:peptidoglycan hydrolase-like protein with peptidoglycan-binding domain
MPPHLTDRLRRDPTARRALSRRTWAHRPAGAVLCAALAGGSVLGVGTGAWASTTTPSPTASATAPAVSTPTPSTTTPPTSGTTSTTPKPTPKPKPKPWAPTWSTTLRPGMKGAAVTAAQKRLQQLGYWVGTPDGRYGTLTTQAVLAVQKSHRMKRTGVLDSATRKAITVGLRPKARTTSGSAIEVDLKRQIVIVVSKGRTRWVLNTSTGSGKIYYQAGRREVAVTPTGRFRIERQIDGLRISALGQLWRPKYFYRGYALHGSPSIPAYPASHGCVRLSNSAMNWLWSSGSVPVGRTVWVY